MYKEQPRSCRRALATSCSQYFRSSAPLKRSSTKHRSFRNTIVRSVITCPGFLNLLPLNNNCFIMQEFGLLTRCATYFFLLLLDEFVDICSCATHFEEAFVCKYVAPRAFFSSVSPFSHFTEVSTVF